MVKLFVSKLIQELNWNIVPFQRWRSASADGPSICNSDHCNKATRRRRNAELGEDKPRQYDPKASLMISKFGHLFDEVTLPAVSCHVGGW